MDMSCMVNQQVVPLWAWPSFSVYLEEQGWLNEYKQGKTTVPYKKISANGTTREQQICMTEYIRHQIHHPENTYNARFNDSQLRRSIEDMRAFVTSKAQTPETT